MFFPPIYPGMATLIQRFGDFIDAENLFTPDKRILLAVSGGVDSVVLTELFRRKGFAFDIAHCNFQLRGEESDSDEDFVVRLARTYQSELYLKRFETAKYAAGKKLSIQTAARELRYAWFYEILEGPLPGTTRVTGDNKVFSFLATAHHLDDNIETLLMHFSKGTGIAGLRGILPKQGRIIRPLLFARKEELRQFALENSLSWTEDRSNESDKYARNYFRNQVIPRIQKVYPAFLENMADNLERFRDIETLYDQSVNRYKKELLYQKNEEFHIPVLKLKKSGPLKTILFEIAREFHFSPAQVPELIKLLDSESGRFLESSTHRILKNRNWLIIAPKQSRNAETILIQEGEKQVFFENGTLELGFSTAAGLGLQTPARIAILDGGKISFPLFLRKWKPGDYFYPLGMTKKKKLGRFFIDNKIPQTDKEKTWVLEMDKKILWVVGRRIDDRFKIRPGSTKALLLEFRSTDEK